MIQNITKIMAFVMALLLLQGCARDLSSDVYTSSSTFNLALEGTVLSARKVTVKDSDRLQGNDIGAIVKGPGKASNAPKLLIRPRIIQPAFCPRNAKGQCQ